MNPTDPTPLPCPFCGDRMMLRRSHIAGEGNWIDHQTNSRCPAQFSELTPSEELLTLWNTRAPSAELAQAQAEAAAMREALERMVQLYESEHDDPTQYRPDWLKGALATATGAELLERLRNAEALAKHFLPTTTENTKPQ